MWFVGQAVDVQRGKKNDHQQAEAARTRRKAHLRNRSLQKAFGLLQFVIYLTFNFYKLYYINKTV